MTIAFSFALTGNRSRYVSGLQPNLAALRSWRSDVRCVLHVDETVEERWLDGWDDIRRWPRNRSLECHFWRFVTAGESRYSAVFCRDIDAVVSARELAAVDEFLKSGRTVHVMRDHWYHTPPGGCPYPIMGGMWGCRPCMLPMDLSRLVTWWIAKKSPFQRWSDCWFLNRYIYPLALANGLVHDGVGSAWSGKPFPTARVGGLYVGETMFE